MGNARMRRLMAERDAKRAKGPTKLADLRVDHKATSKSRKPNALLYSWARAIEFLIARCGLSRMEVWNMTPREISGHLDLASRREASEFLRRADEYSLGYSLANTDKQGHKKLMDNTKKIREHAE